MRAGLSRWNAYVRSHRSARIVIRIASRPLRRLPLPVLSGHGKGLRLRAGPSTLLRVVSSLETEVEAAFLACLRSDATVYDIGANVGWFSLLAARRVGPGGRVIAFEPSVENAAVLQANASSNDFSNITAIPAAVADRDGWARFAAASSLQGHLDPQGGELIPVIAVDSWLKTTNQPPPDVIKIDVEGAEAAVLLGMTQTLRGSRPTLIIELHGTANEVADILDSAGYRYSLIDAAGEVREAPSWAHVIGRPGAPDDG